MAFTLRWGWENQGVQEESVKRTKEFKKKQLSDKENDLSHKSVTCPSIEGVTSHIIVLGTCVQRHGTKVSMHKVYRYQCMCETVASLCCCWDTKKNILWSIEILYWRSNRWSYAWQMSVERYLEIHFKYGHVSWMIFGDGCDGPNCMDMAVARPIT